MSNRLTFCFSTARILSSHLYVVCFTGSYSPIVVEHEMHSRHYPISSSQHSIFSTVHPLLPRFPHLIQNHEPIHPHKTDTKKSRKSKITAIGELSTTKRRRHAAYYC